MNKIKWKYAETICTYVHSYPLKYYRLKGANNGKTSVVTAVTPTWGANLCILWIFYLTLLTYFRFSCITIVNLNKKTHKWNMSMKKALSIFKTLLCRSIENQYQFRFFFSKSDKMTPVFDIHVPINKEKQWCS